MVKLSAITRLVGIDIAETGFVRVAPKATGVSAAGPVHQLMLHGKAITFKNSLLRFRTLTGMFLSSSLMFRRGRQTDEVPSLIGLVDRCDAVAGR